MNKKILIGSIIAVVILVLMSFTGVVGYQTTKSSTISRVSPLFSIRSKRAIGQEQKDITTDYLGYGEATNIQFSSRIERAEKVQKAVNIISKMNDRAFSKMVARIILQLRNQEQMTDIETSDALQALQYIRKNPNDIKYYDTKNNPRDITFEYLTCSGFPGCLIETIALIFMIILLFIYNIITSQFNCNCVSGDMWCTEYKPC